VADEFDIKELPGPWVYCGHCGDWTPGEPEVRQVGNTEHDDFPWIENTDSLFTLDLEAIKRTVSTYVFCPDGCYAHISDNEIVKVDVAYQCPDCESKNETREEAIDCCGYVRRQAREKEKRLAKLDGLIFPQEQKTVFNCPQGCPGTWTSENDAKEHYLRFHA